MNTKKIISESARTLFNKKGVMNITLRDVAKELNKSYGNITYHFPTKDDLISYLLNEMNEELLALQLFDENEGVLMNLLNLPDYYYSISLKYLFFVVDYLELKRNYPKLQKTKDSMDVARKNKWMNILLRLNQEGYFIRTLEQEDLEYIIFLSFSVRVTYFQKVETKAYKKSDFNMIVNKLLHPYLSKKGNTIYNKWLFMQTAKK